MDDNLITIMRAAIGLTMVAFGLSQLKDPKEWLVYVPHIIEKRLAEVVSLAFMRLHGVVNVGLGALYAAGLFGGVAAWLTFGWWLSILPFAFLHNWKIGMRDFSIVAATLAVALALR